MTQILFDFNNAALMALYHQKVDVKGYFDIDFWWFTLFDRIHNFIITVAAENTGPIEVYLCGDLSGPSWRKDLYDPYKGDRVPDMDIDWNLVWERLDDFKEYVAKYLPYHYFEVPGAEADDIIAILTRQAEVQEQKTVIYSTDSDYLQLLSEYTKVYKPSIQQYVDFPAEVRIAGTKVMCYSPEHFLNLSILTGQGGKDNVYNVKTKTNWAPTPDRKRKPPFGVVAAQKAIDAGIEQTMVKLGATTEYKRNSQLIDFNYIPRFITERILSTKTELSPLNNDFMGFAKVMNWPSYLEDSEDIDEIYKIIFKELAHGSNSVFQR